MIAEFCETATLAEVREGLAQAFARPFGCWHKRAEGWVCDETGCQAPNEMWATALDGIAAGEPGRAAAYRVDDATLLVGAAVTDAGGGSVVVAGAAPADPELLAKLLTGVVLSVRSDAQQQAEQSQLLESYSHRLADSYEELAFLRRLSQYVEYCDATNSLADVAASMIPSLRELVRIEGLALFRAEQTDDGHVGVADLAASHGKLRAAQEDWFRVIESLMHGNPTQVVVKNFPQASRNSSASPLAQVRSVVVAPIVKEQTVYGWLVGVNKIDESNHLAGPANSLGFDEIGSMEATLLQSAAALLATHAANVSLFKQHEQLVVDAIHTLVGVVEAKDAYTCGHSDRVALFGRRVAQELGMSAMDCHHVYLAGLLHDIGKVGVADDVLLKPGSLTNEEFAQIRRHPETGWRLLYRLKPLRHLLPAVLHHHEAMDGSGYPYGLSGEVIPLDARILAVVDAWDAMTSNRPYRDGMSIEKAESILRSGAGKQWDAEVVGAFLAARDDIHETMRTWKNSLSKIMDPPWEADEKAASAEPARHADAAAPSA